METIIIKCTENSAKDEIKAKYDFEGKERNFVLKKDKSWYFEYRRERVTYPLDRQDIDMMAMIIAMTSEHIRYAFKWSNEKIQSLNFAVDKLDRPAFGRVKGLEEKLYLRLEFENRNKISSVSGHRDVIKFQSKKEAKIVCDWLRDEQWIMADIVEGGCKVQIYPPFKVDSLLKEGKETLEFVRTDM